MNKPGELLVRPIAIEDESPAGLIIRAAEKNMYGNVNHMVTAAKTGRDFDLPVVVSYVDRFIKLISVLGLKFPNPGETMERETGTIRSKRRFMRHFFPIDFFRVDGEAYCPACLKEKSYLRKIWMFRPYSKCHLHNVPIETSCRKCKSAINIFRGTVNECDRCKKSLGHDIGDYEPNMYSAWVHNFVNDHQNPADADYFSQLFSWGITIFNDSGQLKTDYEATKLTYSFFNEPEKFDQVLHEYAIHDTRHLKIKLMPLLKGAERIASFANRLIGQYGDSPYSQADLLMEVTLTDAAILLDVTGKTMGLLLKRNGKRATKREQMISIGELFNLVEIDRARKIEIKQDVLHGLLEINEVATMLDVHHEIIRSLHRAGYLQFDKQLIKGAHRYVISPSLVQAFSEEFVLVGTLARKFGVNATALTSRLAALGIQPAATPKDSELKTCIFRQADVQELTTERIQSVKNCATTAGRRRKDALPPEPKLMSGISIIEASEKLGVSIQQIRTLLTRGVLQRDQGFNVGVRVTLDSLEKLMMHLSSTEYMPAKDAAQQFGISIRELKISWASTGIIEYFDYVYWELVKISDVLKVSKIRSEFVTSAEGGILLGNHRGHVVNLYMRGLIERHFFDKSKKVALYRKSDVLKFKVS